MWSTWRGVPGTDMSGMARSDGGVTHLTVAAAHFQEREHVALDAGDEVGQDSRETNRRVSHLVGSGAGKGGSPVDTSREIKVILLCQPS